MRVLLPQGRFEVPIAIGIEEFETFEVPIAIRIEMFEEFQRYSPDPYRDTLLQHFD